MAWSAEPAGFLHSVTATVTREQAIQQLQPTNAHPSAHCHHHNAQKFTIVGSCLRNTGTMLVWVVQTALEAVGTGGTVVQVGLGQDNCCAPTQQTVFKEINFTGSWLYTNTVSNLYGGLGHMTH